MRVNNDEDDDITSVSNKSNIAILVQSKVILYCTSLKTNVSWLVLRIDVTDPGFSNVSVLRSFLKMQIPKLIAQILRTADIPGICIFISTSGNFDTTIKRSDVLASFFGCLLIIIIILGLVKLFPVFPMLTE